LTFITVGGTGQGDIRRKRVFNVNKALEKLGQLMWKKLEKEVFVGQRSGLSIRVPA
jgi:hypothetical protein